MGRKGKIVLMVALMFFLFSLSMPVVFTDRAEAASWYTCNVLEVGVAGSDKVYILLEDLDTFGRKWFSARPGREKEMLAMALTAISNNMRVHILATLAASGPSPIYTMYLMP